MPILSHGAGQGKNKIARLALTGRSLGSSCPLVGTFGTARMVVLDHEADNRYDGNTIWVRLLDSGDSIGRLSDVDARAYRPVMDRLAELGMRGKCRIRISPVMNGLWYEVRAYLFSPKRLLVFLDRVAS